MLINSYKCIGQKPYRLLPVECAFSNDIRNNIEMSIERFLWAAPASVVRLNLLRVNLSLSNISELYNTSWHVSSHNEYNLNCNCNNKDFTQILTNVISDE